MRHLKWQCVASGLVLTSTLCFTVDPSLVCQLDAYQTSSMSAPLGDPGHGGGLSSSAVLENDLGDNPTPTPTPTALPNGDPGHGGGGLSSITMLDSDPSPTPTTVPGGDPGHGGGGLSSITVLDSSLDFDGDV